MSRTGKLLVVLLVFLGPGFVIWWIANTISNHFIKPPYLGWEYTRDASGNITDSAAYTIPDFELTTFDGKIINRDSIRNKFIIVTTLQDECPSQKECGLGVVLFNEIIYSVMLKHPDGYHNVRVLSILTDQDGNADSTASELLVEEMKEYDQKLWWMTTGDPSPFYSFNYYGDQFNHHPSTPEDYEIGKYAFTNSLVLIDKEGYIRGVSNARSDTHLRNFFDILKLLKKEEFDANRQKRNK
ncbi:MAG: hypothetical protein IPM74_13510 [Crocinitomicaceae bacterium]|nr:hypothetical protein [Crocinitomicaceae bacterium]